MRTCPYCAEEIGAAAFDCKHCGREFPKGERAPAPKQEQLFITPSKTKKGSKETSGRRTAWLMIIGLGLLICIGFAIASSRDGGNNGGSEQQASRITIWCPECADEGMEINLWDKPGGLAEGAQTIDSLPHSTRVEELGMVSNGRGR